MEGDFEIKSLFALEDDFKFIKNCFIHMKMMKYIYCLDHIHVANRTFTLQIYSYGARYLINMDTKRHVTREM